MNHDIITIGASAGGLSVLLDILPNLPRDLPAAVFVVLHSHADYPSRLPDLLNARAQLPAAYPVHGETVTPGHIYVAPPDNQLYLRRGNVEVVRGPRENGHRPAVDALFRTAAAAYGARVIGVVLSGYQDCGTAGMMAIVARGGLAVVQDPATAQVPEMPRHVTERVKDVVVAPPPEMAALLARLVASPAADDPPVALTPGEPEGPKVDVVCPLCQGVMTEDKSLGQFCCHVGHRFSLEGLCRAQDDSLERALWAAVRALEEAAALSRRMASASDLGRRFAERARTQAAQADLIRNLLLQPSLS